MTSKAFELAKLGNAFSDGALSNRNLIINGAMTVAQRTMGPVTVAPYNYNTADRMRFSLGAAGSTWTQEIVTDQDVGDFIGNALKNTCTVAGSGEAGNNIRLELQDVERFVGQTLTLSFYAKSDTPITLYPAIFGDTVVNMDTVTLTNTYQRYTRTFVVPSLSTKSFFDLSMRADATVATSHYITGVQLEVGDTATPFEHEPYGVTLQKCRRYYQRVGHSRYTYLAHGKSQVNYVIGPIQGFDLQIMRVSPTGSFSTSTGTAYTVARANIGGSHTPAALYASKSGAVFFQGGTTFTNTTPDLLEFNSGSGVSGIIEMDAEL